MYVITNRRIKPRLTSLKKFGKEPSERGPNELRLLKVSKGSRGWKAIEVPDKLTSAKVKAIKSKHGLGIDPLGDHYGSLGVAGELFEEARKSKKSILIFVHGYNNDIYDVVETAEELQNRYHVIVVIFSWPANGGGPVSGKISYLSDKSDARASAGALNRAVEKVQQLHQLYTEGLRARLEEKVNKMFPNNHSLAYEELGRLLSKECSIKLNLVCHSMGNYLLKHTLKSSDNATSHLVCDNIILIAADTNNENHCEWVDKLNVRNRIYVVINENDFALGASRMKPGKNQKARLGHCLYGLESKKVRYVDLTPVPGVERKHSYFKGEYLDGQPVENFFNTIFNGLTAEEYLQFHADVNCYRLKSSQ